MNYNEIEETAYWHICKALDALEEYYRVEMRMDDPIEKMEEDMNRLLDEAIEDGGEGERDEITIN